LAPTEKELSMTTIDNRPVGPQPPLPPPGAGGRGRNSGRPRDLWIGGALVFGLALGAGSLALAAGELDHAGWGGGMRLAFAQGAATRALDSIGATSQQEAKIHDIIATKFADMAPDPVKRDAFRKQASELLGAPTIDRAAVEKLRMDVVAAVDAKSKEVVEGILEIADQLNPDQRKQLLARLETMHPGGPMHGGHGPMGGYDDGPDKD
jgi:protein CpxP